MISGWRVGLALLLPFAVGALQWVLWDPWIKPFSWLLFYPAAFFCAWLGGMAAGIGGTLICALLAWYFFIDPMRSFELHNAKGSVISAVIFIITGCLFAWFHVRLRHALRSSEGQFEATFEQAAAGMALMAPNGRFLRVNHKLCEIVGYDAETLTTMSYKDITHPADLETSLACIRRALAGEINTFSIEKRHMRREGGIAWVNLTVSLIRKPNGDPDRFIEVIEDITARKRAERRFEQLFENAPIGLSTSNRDGRIILMNRAFVALFGHRPEDTPTVSDWRAQVLIDSGQNVAAERDWIDQWQTAQEPSLVEHQVRCRDGSRKTVLLSRMRLGDEMVLAAIDISARKLAEEEIRHHNEELQRFDSAAIGRELDMIRLKREINALLQELGRAPAYDLDFADSLEADKAP